VSRPLRRWTFPPAADLWEAMAASG
jgi:hypothetical protein